MPQSPFHTCINELKTTCAKVSQVHLRWINRSHAKNTTNSQCRDLTEVNLHEATVLFGSLESKEKKNGFMCFSLWPHTGPSAASMSWRSTSLKQLVNWQIIGQTRREQRKLHQTKATRKKQNTPQAPCSIYPLQNTQLPRMTCTCFRKKKKKKHSLTNSQPV